MSSYIKKHKVGIITSFFVGLVCILPQFFFIYSLGDNYRGIHMLATPNEDAYIAIMQEVLDGHTKVASMPFFEYKDKIPLLPSTLFKMYTIPVFFGISLVTSILIGKFIFPLLLFFAIYIFFYDLVKVKNKREGALNVIFAVTSGILIVFGFDLVDYGSIISYIKGVSSPQGFLIWTRPVNPVSGAILLFFFLYCLNRINLHNKKKRWVLLSGASLAIMMASYVFSWTLAFVVLGLFSLRALLNKDWNLILNYLLILFLGIMFSLGYWINNIQASKIEWYPEAAARIGMFFTRTPHINKFVVASLLFFTLSSIYGYYAKIIKKPFPYWWWVSLVLLLSSIIVYNQQIITGVEVWYYHYVFYTIPFSYISIMLIMRNIYYEKFKKITLTIVLLVLATSSFLAVYQQMSAYSNRYSEFSRLQSHTEIFSFFNSVEKECAVLSTDLGGDRWSNLIPAFTHCNSYYSTENQSVLTNPDDFYHRYLSLLRIRGVDGADINRYIEENRDEASSSLQYQLQRTLGFPDLKLDKRLSELPGQYVEFLKQDFYTELSVFKIDYVLSEGRLKEDILNDLPNLSEVYSNNGIFIYQFLP